MRRRLIHTFIIVIISLYLLSIMASALEQSHNISGGIPPADEPKKYVGVCYGPFRDNEAPGNYPTLDELQEDINFISKLANSTRTYSVAGTLSEVPYFCQDAGIDCYPGAWISKQKGNNEREIQRLIDVANQNLSCIKGLIVGNEVLLRDDVTEDELIEYITQVKNNTTIPVSTAEIWGTWLDHPQLAENVDYIIIHIHPYWEGGTYYGESRVGREGIPASNASEHVIEKWKEVKAKYPDKDVIIGETGWPTQGETIGDAIPSEENQMLFLSDFLTAAEENNTRYFYFEVFDEPYKACSDEANVAEGHWGLYYSNGSLKPLLKDLVPEETREGFYRPPRDRKVTLPWFVYKDALSPENHFIPSGWMGDLVDWPGDPQEIFDDACAEAPYSGDTCVKITYVPGPKKWSGIYWQFPENNWGNCPGYDISGAIKLTFWAKGAKGGEKAEFKTGGIDSPGKPFRDSFGPVSTDPAISILTTEWKKYEINLSEQDLCNVIGGFCWVTNDIQNPNGCTIYIDDISFVGPQYMKTDVGVTSNITLADPEDITAYLPPEYDGVDISDAVVLNVNVSDFNDNSTDDAYTDITVNVGELDVETCKVFKSDQGFLLEVDDVTTLPTVKPPGEPAFSRDVANNTVTVRLYVGDPLLGVIPPAKSPWDINEDGITNYLDAAYIGIHYGETTTEPYPRYDINKDGVVNYLDAAYIGIHYGESTA